jgi:hypothetical protein
MKGIAPVLVALVCLGETLAGETPRQAFVKDWTGQTVVVKTALYSLIYNERGRLGNTRSGLRDGLVVTTPSQGVYLQFDGRQGRDTVVETYPHRLVSAVNEAYAPDSLEVRSFRKVEALAVNRFDPGVELVVSSVRIERDQVKLELTQPGGGRDPVTSIRARLPLPLSSSLTERALLEGLLQLFVEIKQP